MLRFVPHTASELEAGDIGRVMVEGSPIRGDAGGAREILVTSIRPLGDEPHRGEPTPAELARQQPVGPITDESPIMTGRITDEDPAELLAILREIRANER
jgi:hypothetical protein